MRTAAPAAATEMQYSGTDWELDINKGDVRAGYELDVKACVSAKHEFGRDMHSSVYIFEPTSRLRMLEVSDLSRWLPVSDQAVDVTMTMAG